jgi:hypothetical protein
MSRCKNCGNVLFVENALGIVWYETKYKEMMSSNAMFKDSMFADKMFQDHYVICVSTESPASLLLYICPREKVAHFALLFVS